MIKPKVGEDTSENQSFKGLQKTYEYLKDTDPTSYYYRKFKSENNPYLNDRMWIEAVKRGEVDTLAAVLENRVKYEAGKEFTGSGESAGSQSIQSLDKEGIDAYSRWKSYEDYGDYDSYMLSLEIPMLDNTEKKTRIGDNGYVFGDYTDREWALEVLNSQFQKIDAQQIEESKNVWTFFQGVGIAIASAPTKILGGVSKFLQDTYNIGEGLLNLVFNWSQDDPEDRFLWAFSNDEGQPLEVLANELTNCTYEIERKFSHLVNANQAYEDGYIAGTNIGRGAGYTGVGALYQSVMDSIGYMLPSVLVNAVIPGSGTTAFYTGMASGNVKDEVMNSAAHGISYKDLNTGEILTRSTLKATAQAGVEIILGKFLGSTLINRLRGITGKVAKEIPDATVKGWKAVKQVFGRMAKEAGHEGLEEVLQDMSDGVIDLVFGDLEGNETLRAQGMDKFNIGDLANSFLAGALTSIAIGSVHNLTYIPQSKRAVGIGEDGKAYSMGLFQTLNYVEALRTMNSWNKTLNDPKASLEDRMATAIKINVAVNTLGSLFAAMGVENSAKANELLNKYANKKALEEKLKETKRSSAEWTVREASKLYNEFVTKNSLLAKTYIPTSLGERIKSAFSKLARKDKLKDTTEIKSMTTPTMKAGDTNIERSTETLEALKKVANAVGAEVLIGTDGSVITRDGNIVIVPQALIDNPNVQIVSGEIIRGLANERARELADKTFTKEQKAIILDAYVKVTGDNSATLELAIDALLFDNRFYTKLLLLTAESQQNEMVNLLLNMYKAIKESNKYNFKTTLDQDAAKVVLNKILNTMRTGIVSYATKYADFDVNNLSDEVFPKELKDAVNNHRNVIFTKTIKTGISQAKSNTKYDNKMLTYFDKTLDSYVNMLTPEIVAQLKKDVRSSEKARRIQAWMVLATCSKIDTNYGSDKLIVLPKVSDGKKVIAEEYIQELKNLFAGASLDQIANGDFDVNKLSEMLTSFVTQLDENGLPIYSLETREDRLEVARSLLYELSKGTFTINTDFNVCEIIDKQDFFKAEYLDDTKLLQDIKDGKIKYVKDIVKNKKFDKNLGNIAIQLGNKNTYTDGDNYITIAKTNKHSGRSIMHELTHVAQYLVKVANPNTRVTTGGTAAMFKGLKTGVEQDLEKYIMDSFPIVYNLIKKQLNKMTFRDVVYYLLEGELEASVSINSLIPVCGFTFKNDRTTLVSPIDTNKTWTLKEGSVQNTIIKAATETAKETTKESTKESTKETAKETAKVPIKNQPSNQLVNDNKAIIQKRYGVDADKALNTVMELLGFTKSKLNNDYTKLINKSQTFDTSTLDSKLLKMFKAGVAYAKLQQQYFEKLSKQLDKPTSEDKPVTFLEALRNGASERLFDWVAEHSDTLLKGQYGMPAIYYRGAESQIDLDLGGLKNKVRFFSTKPFVSSGYAKGEDAKLVGYFVNIKPEEMVVIDANFAPWSSIEYKGQKYNTDDILRKIIHEDRTKKAILFKNILEDANENKDKAGNSLALIRDDGNILKRVTTEDNGRFIKAWQEMEESAMDLYEGNPAGETVEDAFNEFVKLYTEDEKATSEERDLQNKDTAKTFKKELGATRQISQKRALQSNLKYFIPKEKGLALQMHPGVADFVEATTNNFDKLSTEIQEKILAGKLIKSDLIDHLAFGKANEYEMQMLAKYLFRNEEVEKLSKREVKDLLKNLEDLSIAAYLAEDTNKEDLNRKFTPKEMLQYYKDVIKTIDSNQIAKASNRAITTVVVNEETGKFETIQVTIDPTQMMLKFFRDYDGTLQSILSLNLAAKKLAAMQSNDIVNKHPRTETGEIINWNWASLMKRAESVYDEEIDTELNELSDNQKRKEISDYLRDTLAAKVKGKNYTAAQQLAITQELQKRLDYIDSLEGEKLNKVYLATMQQEATIETKKRAIEGIENTVTKDTLTQRPTSTKSSMDAIRIAANNIAKRLAGLKTRYNKLPSEIKPFFKQTGKYNQYEYVGAEAFKDMSDEEKSRLVPIFQNAASELKSQIKVDSDAKTRTEKVATKAKVVEKVVEKVTIKEKVDVIHKVHIVNQTFTVDSPLQLTYNEDPAIPASGNLIEEMLNTTWSKMRQSEVQGVENNEQHFVANYKEFIKFNADKLLSADLNTISEACKWFLSTKLSNATDEDFRQFNVIKQMFLETVLNLTRGDGIFAGIDANLKKQIDNWVAKNSTANATGQAVHGAILKEGDPLVYLRSEDIEMDGVIIPDELKDKLFDALDSMSLSKVNEVIREVRTYVEDKRTNKKSFLHKVQTARQLSMLSGPLTWLRNKASNFFLKHINKLASAIGNRLFKGKTIQSIKQIKLASEVSEKAKSYIEKTFVDSGMFDKLVASLSKYNPSQVKQKSAEGRTKEEIFASMVIKTMYNEYYNEHNFDTKFMNKSFQWIMARMSDDSYVREAAIRYFGKIITEKGYNLTDEVITDEIMNDFSNAVGLAMFDYMHSDNFFNTLERAIAERSEAGWFVYKTILTFASASWNWFKAMTKLTPFGLGRAIVNMCTLERRVAKQQIAWEKGLTQINPELTEYIARRDLGIGVIGTTMFLLGMMLAGLGFIKLDDDDYGNPKLKIGNLTIDISSIFGTSSLLAGGALITGFRDEKSFKSALNRMLDVTLDNFPIMDILELDMYSNGSWDILKSTGESLATSYIPNFLSYLAGATYSGNVKKNSFWARAIAKVPFMANFLDKQVNPYTGDTGSYIDALNRMIPYFSWKAASENESKTNALGLNKSQLRGSYTINNKNFSVSGKALQNLNENYGKWNAEDLTKFYSNRMSVRVKVGTTYKNLTYNQMTNEQRKNAVQTIMSNNAEIAKIYAWTTNGNKYYTSEDTYAKLIKRGVKKNVYVGTKGFVEK